MARRAEIGALHRDGCCERALRRRPQVEVAPPHDVVAEALAEGRRDLVADLVAARADARADDGVDDAAEGPEAGVRDPGEEPAPARVEHADRALARERDGQAVRG